MEHRYYPPNWDNQPGGSSSSQRRVDRKASKQAVPGNMEEALHSADTLSEHEIQVRGKWPYALGRSLSALQSSQLQPSSSSMNPIMVSSEQIPLPSVQIPPPSGRFPPPYESGKWSNPFPTEFGPERDERLRPEAPKQHALAQGSSILQMPIRNVITSPPIFPIINLNDNAIRQRILLAGMKVLAMNNPSLSAQLLPGQNNSVNDNSIVNQLDNLPILGGNMTSSVPDGSGVLKYCAPNKNSFVFDQKVGLKFDPNTGLHYDANSGFFINLALKTYLRWDPLLNTYLQVDLTGSRQPLRVGAVPQNPGEALKQLGYDGTMENTTVHEDSPYCSKSDEDHRIRRKRSHSSPLNDRIKEGHERHASRSRSKSPSIGRRGRSKDRNRSRSRSKGDRRSPIQGRTSNSQGARRSSSRGRKGRSISRGSRSPSGWNRKSQPRSPGRPARRSHSRGKRNLDRRSRSRRRSHSTGASRSRSRGRRSHSRGAWRSRSRGRRSHGRERRSHSRGAWRSRSRGRRSRSRGARRSCSRVRRRSHSRSICRSPGPLPHLMDLQLDVSEHIIEKTKRAPLQRAPDALHRMSPGLSSERKTPPLYDHRTGSAVNDDIFRNIHVIMENSYGREQDYEFCAQTESKHHSKHHQISTRLSPRRITPPPPSYDHGTGSGIDDDITRNTSLIMGNSYGSERGENYDFSAKTESKHHQISPKLSPRRPTPPLSSFDHRTGSAVGEDISRNAPAIMEMSHYRDRQEWIESRAHAESKHHQARLGDVFEYDLLKETVDENNESVTIDEYGIAVEHDESIYQSKSPELKEEQTEIDVLGRLFTNNKHLFNNIVLVAPVPLQDNSTNCKDLKSQIGAQDDVVKIQVFNKSMGSPCHYMLIFFRTTEAATLWYKLKNCAVILSGYDGSKLRGYLHFVGSGNWNCSNCRSANFPLRVLCRKCYQAKDNGYSPVSVSKKPTKWVGISKLKSCFATTESVLESMPSLDMFNVQNIQMITEPRDLPLGLCVFEVHSAVEGTLLHKFFRQQGRASIYVVMNEKLDDSDAEPITDSIAEPNPDRTVKRRFLTDDEHKDDPLAPLFNNKMPKNILLVVPIPLPKTHENMQFELSLTCSYLQTVLKDDGVKYNNVTLHIDENVGAPCSYGLINFPDAKTAARWRRKHNNSLNINIMGWQFPTSRDTAGSFKVFLHFTEDNWECQSCLTTNFFFRSLCHNCFFHRDENVSCPITKSMIATRWVATSKLTNWFAGNDSIVAEMKRLMNVLKLTRIYVLRDPNCPALPLGCVYETESWEEGLGLRELILRTGRFSLFVTTNQSFDEFTCCSPLDNNISQMSVDGESTTAGVNYPASNNTSVNNKTKPLPGVIKPSNLSRADISESLPDRYCKNYLLWWSRDLVSYSDILNDLFVKNPLTRVPPGTTIFVGPLPSSLHCTSVTAVSCKKILTDKLVQDNLPFKIISIFAGPLFGAPCTYSLVYFETTHDAKAWHDKHKGGLILPTPQPSEKSHTPLFTPTSGAGKFFKTFVYYCEPNWRCASCHKFNFGLRSNCFTCLSAKGPSQKFIKFSDTPTNYVCIRQFKSWCATKELLVAHNPFLKNYCKSLRVKILKERSGIPLGTCILVTEKLSDAVLLFDQLRKAEGQEIVHYVILPLSVILEVEEMGSSCNTIECHGILLIDDGQIEVDPLALLFTDETPKNIILFAPVPRLETHEKTEIGLSSTDSYLHTLLLDEGVKYNSIAFHIDENVGAPCSYGLINFPDPETAAKWYSKHNYSLNIKSIDKQPSSKIFLHFSEDNWDCQNCLSTNFFLRSLCHVCFCYKSGYAGPIMKSITTTRLVATSKLTSWFAGNEHIEAELKKLLKNSKLTKICVLRDPEFPVLPLGCIFETESWGQSLHLRDFFLKTGRFSMFVATNRAFNEFTDRGTISGDVSLLNKSTPMDVDDRGFNNTPSNTETGAKTLPAVIDTPNSSTADISEPAPDDCCENYLLWWSRDLVKWYSVVLNRLFVQNPLTQDSPGHTLFVGPLPASVICSVATASAFQKILADKLEQDNIPFTDIRIHSGLDSGAPCTYGLVCFSTPHDAEAFHDKHKGGLILPSPQPVQKPAPTIPSTSGKNKFFKTFVYHCQPNWRCWSCNKFNFGLRSHCFKCLASKEPGSKIITFSDTPTRQICIRRFAHLYVTKKLHPSIAAMCDPFSEKRRVRAFSVEIPKEKKCDIPLGILQLETKTVSDAVFLFGQLRKTVGRKRVRYIAFESVDEFRGIFTKNLLTIKKSKILFLGPVPGLSRNAEFYKSLISEEGADCDKVECYLAGTVGSPFDYCLVHFNSVILADDWYKKCQGRISLKQKALPDGKSEAIKPADAFLHFTEGNWICNCGSENFPCRIICFHCYKGKCAKTPPFNISSTPTKWLGLRLKQWYPTIEKALSLGKKKYNSFRMTWVICYGDKKIPRDNSEIYIIATSSVETAQSLRQYFNSLGVTRSTDFIEWKNLGPGEKHNVRKEVHFQVKLYTNVDYNLYPNLEGFVSHLSSPETITNSGMLENKVSSEGVSVSSSPVPVPNSGALVNKDSLKGVSVTSPRTISNLGTLVNEDPSGGASVSSFETISKPDADALVKEDPIVEEVLVSPDYETILWTSLYDSRLNNPPTNVIMISLCPGGNDLPREARTQIQKSLQAAGVNHESIVYSFKREVGSPFSYCLVSFYTTHSAETWVDKCGGVFKFNVPCPDDNKTPLTFQNCYSHKSSHNRITLIKSKLHYSSPNWKCSCGSLNFPLRSLCHDCLKNKDQESDYESVPDDTRFVGIKLTEYRNLLNFNPIIELHRSGLKPLTVAICFDPTLPRDPCGVVLFEVESLEFGTKLYDLLTKKTRIRNYKRLMMLLENSSGIRYFKCPKSLQPNWSFCRSEYWESYFDKAFSNIIAVDMDIIDIPKIVTSVLRRYHGRIIKSYEMSSGFVPGFWFINFFDLRSAVEWYNDQLGTLQNQVSSVFHPLHFTQDLWACVNCGTSNFPARVLCHKCYRHRTNGFSPISLSKEPTSWVGIAREPDQKQAMAILKTSSKEFHCGGGLSGCVDFKLKSVRIFFDPIVRQDGTCIFVFEAFSPADGMRFKQFLMRKGIQNALFFELSEDSKMNTRVVTR